MFREVGQRRWEFGMEGSFWLAGNEAQVMVIDDLETFFQEKSEHTATSKSTSAENFQKSQLDGSTAWNSDKSDLNNWRKKLESSKLLEST